MPTTDARPRPGPARTAGGLVYDVVGDGPPLLLLHGVGSSRRVWDVVRPLLVESFATYAVDLPGHGDSPLPSPAPDRISPQGLAAAVGALLDDVGLDRPHVVGNSLGGWVALELAADARASSVTALCPAGLWDPPLREPSPHVTRNGRLARLSAPFVPVLLRTAAWRRLAFAGVAEHGERIPFSDAVTAVRAQAAAAGFQPCHIGMVGPRFDRGGAIPADTAVTIVFGDRDRLLPAPRFQVRSLVPPPARWVVVHRCGHAPQWDVPAEVARQVRLTAGV